MKAPVRRWRGSAGDIVAQYATAAELEAETSGRASDRLAAQHLRKLAARLQKAAAGARRRKARSRAQTHLPLDGHGSSGRDSSGRGDSDSLWSATRRTPDSVTLRRKAVQS